MEMRLWKDAALKGNAPQRVILTKVPKLANPSEVKAVEGQERALRYIISSSNPDRYRDIVHQDGMDSSDYHGVVLWAHHYGGWDAPPLPPIAKNLSLSKESRRGVEVTVAEASFAGRAQNHELAETIYSLAVAGFLPDASIGFDVDEWSYDEERGGFDFRRWQLVEWSVVPIGANQDAVQLSAYAKAHGISLAPIDTWARQALDLTTGEQGLYLPKSKLEAIVKALGYGRGLKLFDLPALDIRTAVRAKVKGEAEPPLEGEGEKGEGEGGGAVEAVPVAESAPAAEAAAVEPESKADEDEDEPCTSCDGTGKCSTCGGTGEKAAEPLAAPEATITESKPVVAESGMTPAVQAAFASLREELAQLRSATSERVLFELVPDEEPVFEIDPSELRAALAERLDELKSAATAATGRVF